MTSTEVTEKVFSLFRKHGNSNYLGEDVTQMEHMVQCAMLAEEAGFSEGVILGALFHDIGHLIGLEEGLETMGNLGTKEHELVGGKFLEELGFPDEVTKFVVGHINAKRYLVFKDPDYYEKLSEASKGTLVFQGGKMIPEEAEKFEASVHFEATLKMRNWDEQAKVPGLPIKPLQEYEEMCKRYLQARGDQTTA